VVEIGANRQSCDTSTMLLFKLVLETVLDEFQRISGSHPLNCERQLGSS